MALLKIGEKDRDGRQKRIEHTGRYLRASRTGGVSLRAHARVSAINLTANTSHGVRVSTQLAKHTQIAFQNGRFVLRGRYGSDAAKLNLSKSGASVSTKTPVGAFNWIRPGRSSFKMGGVQLRGHKAAHLHAIYLLFALAASLIGLVLQVVALIFRGLGRCVRAVVVRWQQARQRRERPGLSITEVEAAGERLLADHDIALEPEPPRDLFAALLFTVVCLGRGWTRFEADSAGMGPPGRAVDHALADDVRVAGEQIRQWVSQDSDIVPPETLLGIMHHLAVAFARNADAATRAETLLALDDACLAAGPRTVLQDEMIDLLPRSLGVDVRLVGEA